MAGAGPAGSAAAIVLARAGWRVLLAESAATPPPFKVGEALPPAARPLLRDLGVLERFERDGHLPSHGTQSAWGSAALGSVDFVFDPNGHGWHLDRVRFDALLRAAALEAGAEPGAAVRIAGGAAGAWRVAVGEDVLETANVVDATGRRAALARALGARRERRDRLVAVYAAIAARADDVDARTLVAAAPGGWWYSALVPGRRRVIAFMTDSDLVPARMRSREGFAAALHESPVGVAMPLAVEHGPHSTAGHSGRLDPVCGPGWAAAGDAALAFDPLSSQGIFNALFTGMAAARALLDGDASGYTERLEAIDGAYRRGLRDFYALEQRWPDEPFWQRRHAL